MYNAMNFRDYNRIITLLREFFQKKGFIEVPAQSNRSILAACEDPKTVGQYIFGGKNYPLPQTGQVVLEEVLLTNPDVDGVFCISTSYRNEPNPIPGRHDLIFPMFEFEGKGGIDDLKKIEKELLGYLGFVEEVVILNYVDYAKKYGVATLESEHEAAMQIEFGNVISLEKFPATSHPFWNMKHSNDGIFNKIDVILFGMETIGSAERSCDVNEMLHFFNTVSNGNYKRLLFNLFTEERVMKELKEYLALKMFPRYGGGIGITRMARAMKLAGLLGEETKQRILEKVA